MAWRLLFREYRERARHVGIFLTDRDVDTVKRPIILIALVLSCLVQTGLADDRVDGDGSFAGCAIADDQLALAATDRNHRVNGHEAGLHRLIDAAALDDARCNCFQRIKCFGFDRSLVIERLAECVYHTAQKRLADGNRQESASCFSFVAFGNQRVVAHQNGAHFSFFKIERETVNAVGKFDHLVKHHVAQTLDARHAVAGFAHNADVALGRGCF